MRLIKFNLEDFVTNVDWNMKAIFEIDGHWIEGILSYDVEANKFDILWYDLDFDRYVDYEFEFDEITNYILLD